ncbi:unnamed protein product [Didymodactylos carnosus]|nr:unnamed protein product [Didymodactylos carnosus]CAF3930350.1 unnamed protein product [Didymodactylos carnosus]
MVDRLAGLSRMLTATSDHEREQFLEQLNNETQNAQDEIEKLARERKKTYQEAVNATLTQLDRYIGSVDGDDESLIPSIEYKNIIG